MATPTRKKPQIDKDQIVAEALNVLNETSLAGLTMRVLADRLGIRAASLYWYFPNKAALITAMSEKLFAQAIENTPDADNWQEWMRGLGRAVWDNLIVYPDSGILVMTADLNENQFHQNSTIVRQELEKFDVDIDSVFLLQAGIQALITGWVIFAHSPFVRKLESMLDMREAAMATLDAMIEGWQARLTIQTSLAAPQEKYDHQ